MAYPRAATVVQKPEFGQMDGISARTVTDHWRIYESLVARANDLRERLQRAAPLDQPHFPALRRDLAGALNEMKLHAIYFSNLGGGGGEPGGPLADLVQGDFGTLAAWVRDLKAAALAAEGWVCAVVDQDDGHLYTLADVVWEGSPVLALDVAEHAYLLDHGADRASYVDAFFANADWGDIAARAERALRRQRA